MKQVHGIWLPDDDTHFEYHLAGNPQFQGAGTYQFGKLKAALDRIPEGRFGVALDIGGHVGLWSRVLATKFRQVIAFEPVPELADCFIKNVDCSVVALSRFALGADHGQATMGNDDPSNTGNWRVAGGGSRGYEVEVVPLDYLELSKVDFVKIDVEGLEHDVVMGGEETIKRTKPFMVIEQKPGHAERYGFTKTAAVDLLNSWGAKVIWIKSGDYFMGW